MPPTEPHFRLLGEAVLLRGAARIECSHHGALFPCDVPRGTLAVCLGLRVAVTCDYGDGRRHIGRTDYHGSPSARHPCHLSVNLSVNLKH